MVKFYFVWQTRVGSVSACFTRKVMVFRFHEGYALKISMSCTWLLVTNPEFIGTFSGGMNYHLFEATNICDCLFQQLVLMMSEN